LFFQWQLGERLPLCRGGAFSTFHSFDEAARHLPRGMDCLAFDYDETGAAGVRIAGVVEGRLDFPAIEAVAIADISLPLGESPEAVEETGAKLALVHERRMIPGCLFDGAGHRQLFILDLDLGQREGGSRLVLCRHGSHRLAGESHLVDGDNRPVLDGVAPIGIEIGEVYLLEKTGGKSGDYKRTESKNG